VAWRVKWTFTQLSGANIAQHRRVLKNPWKFYWTLLVKLIPGLWRQPLVLTLRDGKHFFVHDFMTLYVYTEIFIDRCYDFELNGIERPRFLDVGANTGLFTLRMKQLFPASAVVCFEPFPRNFNQLLDTIRVNDLAHVKPIEKGVGGRARSERLYVHPRNIGGHSIHAEAATSHTYVNIELIDLPTALHELAGNACEMLKLDCEGAEKEILESMTPETASRISRIVFEPTGKQNEVEPTLNKLRSLGYLVNNKHGLFFAERAAN
jgi:FkbM family methyltransferase